MNHLRTLLENGPLLADGAWGTEFQKRGLALGQTPDLWNLTHPELVLDVARSYVDAGSRVILTNTFRANAFVIGPGQAPEVNRAGVLLSKQAAAGKAKVFASIGPSGKALAGEDIATAELESAFRQQCEACAGAGADALLLETFSDVAEARIAMQAARDTGLPVIVSFAFDSGRNKDRTMMGVTPEQAVTAALESGADAIGANCGVGIEQAAQLCARFRAAAPDLPRWIKPNAGLPVLENGAVRYHVAAAQFAAAVPALLEAGASFVGGCCGSSPDFIREIRKCGGFF